MGKQVVTAADAPAAVGPYSHAIKSGGFLYASGQIPLDPATGKLVPGDVTEQTQQVLANVKAVLAAAGCSLADVVKATVFLTDMNDFAAMNEVYKQHFTEPYPARSCFCVAALPAAANVEIEVVAKLND